MALITNASDPALYATLLSILAESPASVVIHSGTHYMVRQDSSGNVAFLAKTNEDLFDSRSITGSKPASYNKLDGS